jgi:6-phospho-3-hexuloisomerase
VEIPERTGAILDELREVFARIDPSAFDALLDAVDGARRLFLAGAGRSRLAMGMTAMRLAQLGLPVHMAGEVTAPSCGEGDLLLVGSGSGSTASLRPLAERARAAGAHVALVTRAPSSPLGTAADVTLLLPVPLDAEAPGGLASSQPLGTLFEQALMLAGDLLVEALMRRRGLTPAQMQARHANLE